MCGERSRYLWFSGKRPELEIGASEKGATESALTRGFCMPKHAQQYNRKGLSNKINEKDSKWLKSEKYDRRYWKHLGLSERVRRTVKVENIFHRE